MFPYRNPETGELPDIAFNPYKLADNLRSVGFRIIEVRPNIPISNERIFLRKILKPLNPLIFSFFSEEFEIVTVKR